jgi:hypothetical protein
MSTLHADAITNGWKATRIERFENGRVIETRYDVEVVPLTEHRTRVTQATQDVLECVSGNLTLALSRAQQQAEMASAG